MELLPEKPLMEFYPGGDGDLLIRFPWEQDVNNTVWLKQPDAAQLCKFIQDHKRAYKESLVYGAG